MSNELDPADRLLFKADALIHRHRSAPVSDDDLPMLDDMVGDDLPVLEDIAELPAPPAPVAAPAPVMDAPTLEMLEEFEREYEARIAELQARLEAAEAQAREAHAQPQEDPALLARLETAESGLRDTQARLDEALVELGDEQAAHALTRDESARRAAALQDQSGASQAIAERLIDLDAYIAQSLETWISRELPQIVAGELDSMVERLRVKTLAHMRATLVPELSQKLSETLDAVSR
ncbi:hypothetical protein [Niveibacterium sp. SC-1]|uniref:hypothetical protein n=1 Tax=Niveibacterium sp. SC-1 TaxID=3135646 RepID=UPI00311E2C77